MTRTSRHESQVSPLRGKLVLDASRMLPGAVLARMLIDLGARLLKIEEPLQGDPLRNAPPLIGGIGAGFCTFYRGAESICLDLRDPDHAAGLRKLVRHADVLVESFRPGSMEAWGVGPARLQEINPALVICMLSAFGTRGANAARVGHDLNLVAQCGLLSLLSPDVVPRVQIADVSAGMLACSAVLGALLERVRSGNGVCLDQPLSGGALPFLTLRMAEEAGGGDGVSETLLSGACPAYRLYRCGDGRSIALGALEPKFWDAFVHVLGLDDLAGAGLTRGPQADAAVVRVEARLGEKPREHWLGLPALRALPVAPVNEPAEVGGVASLDEAGLLERTPTPGGGTLPGAGPFVPSLARTPGAAAPRLGEHTGAVAREFGLSIGAS